MAVVEGLPVYCVDCGRYAGEQLRGEQKAIDGVVFSFCPMLCGTVNILQEEFEDDEDMLQIGTRTLM